MAMDPATVASIIAAAAFIVEYWEKNGGDIKCGLLTIENVNCGRGRCNEIHRALRSFDQAAKKFRDNSNARNLATLKASAELVRVRAEVTSKMYTSCFKTVTKGRFTTLVKTAKKILELVALAEKAK
ncbi:MAG: hypothetical protein AB7G35_07325 [Hyphomicrobiaceae bacterium]